MSARKNLLLRGPSGVGRTTVLQKVMALLPKVRFGGFFSHRAPGSGGGRRLVLVEGKHRELAEALLARPAPLPGVLVFDSTSLVEEAVPCVRRALRDAEVVVLDSLGPMEAAQPDLVAALEEALASPHPVLLVVPAAPHPLVDQLTAREDTRTIHVLPETRATLPQEIADQLVDLLGGAGSEVG